MYYYYCYYCHLYKNMINGNFCLLLLYGNDTRPTQSLSTRCFIIKETSGFQRHIWAKTQFMSTKKIQAIAGDNAV